MEIINKSDSGLLEEYESFVKNHKNGSYLQSLKWPKLKTNWGWDAVISRGSDGKIRGTCLLLIKEIRGMGTSFLYAPRGPVFDYDDAETFEDLFAGIKQLGKKYKSYQFMCDPFFEEGDEKRSEFLKSRGFTHTEHCAPFTTVQVRENYMIRGIKGMTPDELMATFKPDWRNRVRKAPKKGVYCKLCGTEALDDFYPIAVDTGVRDGFTVRSKEYFNRFISAFGEDECRLFMCYVEEDGKEIPLSGAVTTRYAGKTVYVYGASANHHRNLYPNYLMQWTMMNWALEAGCDTYDFGGIPYYDDESNSAYGVYKFKKGFNGEVVTFAGEYYYTLRPVMTKLANLGHKMYELRRRLMHKHVQDIRSANLKKAEKEKEKEGASVDGTGANAENNKSGEE